MKLIKKYRLVDSSGLAVLTLDADLFTRANVLAFYRTYSTDLEHRGALKIMALDALGGYYEIAPEDL